MRLQALLTSHRAAEIALSFSRNVPVDWGYRIAASIGRRFAAQSQTPLVQALRSNHWVVGRGAPTAADLDRTVPETLEHIAIAFFQLFRFASNPPELQKLVEFSPLVDELIFRSQEKRRGLIVAGLHMSGFDLVSQAVAMRGLQAIALSLPQTTPTVEWQHGFRRRSGLEILPSCLGNLRRVINRLSMGEVVITGIDRPMPDLKYRPLFFGRPALVPTHHIYLALKAHVPLMVLGAIRSADGRYRIVASPEIHLQNASDRTREMVSNAERVLEAAQDIICQAVLQWAVPYPVWPEAVSETPASLRP